jgi:hypothetical protein
MLYSLSTSLSVWLAVAGHLAMLFVNSYTLVRLPYYSRPQRSQGRGDEGLDPGHRHSHCAGVRLHDHTHFFTAS